MRPVSVHRSAATDLLGIAAEDRVSAQRLQAVIEHMKGDEDMQDALLDHKAEHVFGDVSKWHEQQRDGHNLWRIKVFDPNTGKDTLDYRIVYGYLEPDPVHRAGSFVVLGIPPRSWNYDAGHPITKRILRDLEGELL